MMYMYDKQTLKGMCNIGNDGKTASMSMLTLFESRYTSKGRYSIGNVGKTASMSMLTLFESRYTSKGRYNIGNVGKTASMSMLTLFESRYTLTLTLFIWGGGGWGVGVSAQRTYPKFWGSMSSSPTLKCSIPAGKPKFREISCIEEPPV